MSFTIRIDRNSMEDLVYPNVPTSTIIGDWLTGVRHTLPKKEPVHLAYTTMEGLWFGYDYDLSQPFSTYRDRFHGVVRIFACTTSNTSNKTIDAPLALFQHKKQLTSNPLVNHHVLPDFINQQRCQDIIEKANTHGKWTSNRHDNYPTTDIPVDNIPNLNVDAELQRIQDLCRTMYKLEQTSVITPFDVFVVKYNANAQNKLELHRDNSVLSFVLLLSHPDEFEGGGTFYQTEKETVRPNQGGLALHCGKVRHAGVAITKGTRYILIGFMKVKSIFIRYKHPQEKKLSNTLGDQRHLDFLWRHPNTLPTRLSIRIINLKRRPEKLKRCMDTVRRLDIPANWVLDIQPVVANEGEGATAYPQWKTNNISGVREEVAKFWKRDVTKGEIGCFVSHMSTIQASNAEYLLVLEDDADMHSDFLYRVDQCLQELKEKEWDAIDFGGVPMDSNKKRNITTSIVQQNYTYQTHCILYHARGMKKVQTVDCTKNAIPYDEFLGALRKIHPRSELNALYATTPLMVYHPYTKLSWQRAENIHDTEDSTPKATLSMPMQTRVGEAFDMKNYYRFSNVTNVSMTTIQRLSVKANNTMWHFQLSTVEDQGMHSYRSWKMALDQHTKLVAVANPSELALFRGTKIQMDCSKPTVFFFPSYILFTCKDAHIFYIQGNTFL